MADNMLESALAAIARGETVIPLCWPDKDGKCACGRKDKAGKPDPHTGRDIGKAPLILAWQKKGAQTQAGVKEYWRRRPHANVGNVIQPGHFILEADKDHGGIESLAKIQEDHGQLPLTKKVKSGGGGYHLYFKYDGSNIRNTVELAGYPGLDVRGVGGQAVAPGSRHKSGNLYELVYDIPEEQAPAWLVELASKKYQRQEASTSPAVSGERIPAGRRNDTLTRMAGRLVHDGLTGEALDAAIRKINETQCDPPLTDDELTMLKSAKNWPAGLLPVPTKAVEIDEEYTTKDLYEMELPPLTWSVDGMVISEGLTVLGGKKKLGKSWMALQIAAAVATGGEFLGRACKQGAVLYYGLEDGKRRLSQRIKEQLVPREAPITFKPKIKPLDQGGLVDIEAKIIEHKPVVVILDTLAAAKSGKIDENAAGDMADLINHLHDLSMQYHLAIIVVAHHGKNTYGDVGMDIRGSSATAGATDTNLGLYKRDGVCTLKGEGRDFEEFDLKIEFDHADHCQWKLVGDTRELAAKEAEQDILDVLETLVEADAGAIAKEAGKTRQTIQPVCKRMKLAGILEARNDDHGKRKKILYSIKK